jgi:site-specific DNA-cytosine methylase
MGHNHSHQNAGGHAAVAQGWIVRRLSPVECERLQGFPDGWTDAPYRRRNFTPDGPRYKALGNSMAVPCMEYIGRRIDLVEQYIRGVGK